MKLDKYRERERWGMEQRERERGTLKWGSFGIFAALCYFLQFGKKVFVGKTLSIPRNNAISLYGAWCHVPMAHRRVRQLRQGWEVRGGWREWWWKTD